MSDALALLAEIDDVGRDPRGGWSRPGFGPVADELRAWFAAQAEAAGLAVHPDANGNVWAWWGEPGPDAVVTGSHLDSVPGGGRFDGPLGVVSALVAVRRLREAGFRPTRPIAVVVFAEEEGSRFGVACLGSRLLTGAMDPTALPAEAGLPHAGGDDAALARIGRFVELHVEQGRGLADLDAPIGLATGVLAHGRWRMTITGRGDHAGSTRMQDRSDPVVAAARVVLAVESAALAVDGARATVGRIEAVPGGTNVIASRVELPLDVRAGDGGAVRALVAAIEEAGALEAARNGCDFAIERTSWSDEVVFDDALRSELDGVLGGVPALPTGAGHDAAVLAAHVPTAMLFVRNPTGVSHAPEEHADDADVDAGVDALERVLRHLAS
ncbi:allantoate amidohydrolase [Amnibacterium kyonggiense]|uniref:N-carbamoyl-L-amino-acid hydrolase n=1 Tax=Amnibacterium kyonggiense TaxID=595671 RepID=A0A4R7FM07_9MICO|nr:allantoate amidohydrolase [Amnibacterium kyonggiense]TDS77433.1 N-carbamoyl-L-amino-acid hydrolase [Amnibacterium kyonggiense]